MMATELAHAQERVDGWFVRNAAELKNGFRILFGVIWLIDGSLKFAPGFLAGFPGSVQAVAQNEPAWLQGWFTFWSAQVNANPTLWVYMTGSFELLLGLALIFGFLRKIAYTLGVALSLLIWAVPEGFGQVIPGSSTDIGTGAVYAIVFVALFVLDATYGPTKWTLDFQIARRWPAWTRVAEIRGFGSGPVGSGPTSPERGPTSGGA